MHITKYKIFLLIVLILNSCDNPFATREPEPPSTKRSLWQQPTNPVIVISNLKNSIIEGKAYNYLRCLSESRFRFIPDDLTKTIHGSFFDSWDLRSEQKYLNLLFTSTTDSIRNARINLLQTDDQFVDSVYIKVEYQLELHHNLDENYPGIAKGQSEFWLIKENGEYFITRWIDIGTRTEPSWSSIKVSFGK